MENKIIRKVHFEYSCYLRIECNGMPLNPKGMFNNLANKLVLAEDEANSLNIFVKNHKGDIMLCYPLNRIERIYDKLIQEGKLTVMINLSSSIKHMIFINNTSKEVLKSLTSSIKKMLTQPQNLTAEKKVDIPLESVKVTKLIENPQRVKKKKIQDFYSNLGPSARTISNSIKAKESKRNQLGITNRTLNKKDNPKKSLNDFISTYHVITFDILEYLDTDSLNQICFVSKQFKEIYDLFSPSLHFRRDTPSVVFKRLLQRFVNVRSLNFGKGKYLRNETLSKLYIKFQCLMNLSFAETSNLNEETYRNFLAKVDKNSLTTITINQNVECLYGILCELFHRFHSLESLNLVCYYRKASDMVEILAKRQYSLGNFLMVMKMLRLPYLSKLTLSYFHIGLFFRKNLSEDFTKKLSFNTNNLTVLNLDFLIIDNIKDLRVLSTGVKLQEFSLIGILQSGRNSISEVEWIQNVYNTEESNIPSIDFDNDYIEVFIHVFSNMRNLRKVKFGRFLNNEILKVISALCRTIKDLEIKENQMVDDYGIALALDGLELHRLNVSGCVNVNGNCFLQCLDFKSLKEVTFNVHNYISNSLVNRLIANGIKVINSCS